MSDDIEIRPVRTREDAAHVRELAWEFIGWLRDRYPEMGAEIDAYLVHQNFAEQIEDVRVRYSPPQGECLLAMAGEAPAGILMLKDLGNGVCEMNRMFVRPETRGAGVGRALVAELIGRARAEGFHRMILSALPLHHEALPLYRSVGFTEDPALLDDTHAENAIMMRLDLIDGASGDG